MMDGGFPHLAFFGTLALALALAFGFGFGFGFGAWVASMTADDVLQKEGLSPVL